MYAVTTYSVVPTQEDISKVSEARCGEFGRCVQTSHLGHLRKLLKDWLKSKSNYEIVFPLFTGFRVGLPGDASERRVFLSTGECFGRLH